MQQTTLATPPPKAITLLYALEAWIESMTDDQRAAIRPDQWDAIVDLRSEYMEGRI